MLPPRRLSVSIPPALDGERVGKVLRTSFQLSGTLLRRIKWLEDGILLDGERVTVRHIVRSGQLLSVRVGDEGIKSGIVPSEGCLNIVYEDDDILVVNKQSGVLSHPGHGHFDDTLGNFVAFYYKKIGLTADYHPVHRLDKGTTGLLVIAKHVYAQERLKSALHTADFRRIYLAICDGALQPPNGMVDAPIRPVEGSLIAREVGEGGLPSRTHYETLSHHQGRSLLRLELDTGRTHQIRVHLSHLGCPLTGDFLYGAENRALISRPALHSSELWLRHPVSGKLFHFTAPLPEDMNALLPHSSQPENFF